MTRILTVVLVAASIATLGAQGHTKRLRADLSSFQEVPTLSTAAHGQFDALIDSSDTTLTYELSYENLTGNVTQAHIHFGRSGTNGGVMIFLCGTAANPGPAGTPACPVPGGSVSRTVGAADVIGPAGQGIAAGEWEEALVAMRNGSAYANVHTTVFPGGEVRGQVNVQVVKN